MRTTPVRLAFVFHLNQDLVPFASLATGVCYLPLLGMLERHKKTPVHLHLAGSLASWAAWEDPQLVEAVAKAVKRGQAELLGSSYAQNMLACSDEWTIANAVSQHREVLARLFALEPQGFWNPEKSWEHGFIGTIAKLGFTWALVEEKCLPKREAARPHLGIHGEARLPLFTDSAELTVAVNGLVGQFSEKAYEKWARLVLGKAGEAEDALLCYCEDAEAAGLWQFEAGHDPAAVLAGWDAFLTRLAADARFETVRLTGIAAEASSFLPLEKSPSGQAAWMDAAFKDRKARWHAAGYKNWADYAKRSPEMAYLGELYSGLGAEVRKKTALLAAYGAELPHREAVVRLTRYAGLILAAHQHEHGLPGQPVRGLARWELARTALVPLYVTDFLLDERFGFSVYDINGDGVQEAVYFDGTYLYAFSPRGGRLLYWYDAAAGVELAGCPFPAHSDEEFPDDGTLVPDRAGAAALWPWLKQPERFKLAGRNFAMRRRVLSGHFSVKRGQETVDFSEAGCESQYLLKLPCIEFSMQHAGLDLHKTIRFARDGFSVEYRLADGKKAPVAVELVVDNAFSPDCHELLLAGPGTVKASAGRIVAPGGTITLEAGENCRLGCEREPFAWNQRLRAKGRGADFRCGYRVRRTRPGAKTPTD